MSSPSWRRVCCRWTPRAHLIAYLPLNIIVTLGLVLSPAFRWSWGFIHSEVGTISTLQLPASKLNYYDVSLKTTLGWSQSTPPRLDSCSSSVQLPADAWPAPLSWQPVNGRLFLPLHGCAGLPGVPALCSPLPRDWGWSCSHLRWPNPSDTCSMADSRQIDN